MWKGRLVLGKLELPVRMYAALQDRTVHFRLLDAATHQPVRQRIVRKTDGEAVPKDERRKAFPLDDGRAVVLTPGELEELEPEPSREIEVCRFVPASLLGDPWYDRPYYLGPEKDAKRYFALAAALEKRAVVGVARWAMRKKRYVGALSLLGGYLALVTLRRADQVLTLPRLEPKRRADAKEIKLAQKLVESIAEDFDPALWQDEYHERVCRLIEAKARGEKPKVVRAKRKRATGGLAAQLRRSLESVKERRAA